MDLNEPSKESCLCVWLCVRAGMGGQIAKCGVEREIEKKKMGGQIAKCGVETRVKMAKVNESLSRRLISLSPSCEEHASPSLPRLSLPLSRENGHVHVRRKQHIQVQVQD